MPFTLTLNTTFLHFADWLDTQLWQMLLSPSLAEDGNQYYITCDWKGDLGYSLDRVEGIREKRQELFGQSSYGFLGVRIKHNPGGGLQRVTEMATISFEITTSRPGHIQVTIEERLAELPATVPPAIKDRLSELLRRIVLVWPETKSQLREQFPELFGDDARSVEPSESGWTPTRRARANLFKRVRRQHHNVTMEQLAALATNCAQQEIEERLQRDDPDISTDNLDRSTHGEMEETYGQVVFSENDVKNDWDKMRQLGEVEAWKRRNPMT